MSKFKRKNKKQADAILSSDWHIRPDAPICRTDDFFSAQEKKIDFILDLSNKHNCPILVGGDFGNKSLNNGWPAWLQTWAINKFKNNDILTIPGQHDLPNHRVELFNTSGLGVLNAAGAIKILGVIANEHEESLTGTHFCPKNVTDKYNFHITPFPYGLKINDIGWGSKYKKPDMPMIAITHEMIIENKDLYPDQNAIKGHEILKKYPEYDLILSGDNHNPFVSEYKGRLLVNPGSIMRSAAAQENHKPRVYLWYAGTNEVECVYLPITEGVISREHIKEVDDRADRYNSYIEKMKEEIELDLSFEDNMEKYLKKFRTEKQVKNKIWENIK